MAGLSLVVSMFLISPGPTTAQTTDPASDYLASFDACPEGVIPPAGFRDVSSRHPNAGDIDCIAYYGITKGTSPTTYSPDAPVIREHMALFLVRLADKVGIDLPPPDSFTPFTDIGDLSQESREAIAQIYQLRITVGTSATTYAPKRNVSRGEMALFLARLMNRMDPVADGRDPYGYIPDDVDDNVDRFDIASPYDDLDAVSVEAYDAVTHLYELGVGSGVSSSLYGPSSDMSRAAMAEFMAGILDHSNLRPQGALVQVTPTSGLDNFDITMMISVRDERFAPVDNRPVDWFYSDDEDGGLVRGVCDEDLIQPNSADCIWDGSRDDETDRDGNIFEDRIEATPGATMTFYAWIGRRDGEEFDDRIVDFSSAQARSAMGPDSISVTWDDRDIPATAFQMTSGEYIVDIDIDLIEFTIQLLDDQGMPLEMEGIDVEIEVDSDDILLFADGPNPATAGANVPAPDYQVLPDDSEYDETVVTDSDGEAVFELFGPRRNDRRDLVTFNPDCQNCESLTYEFAWSDGTPVLVTARPQFDLYVRRSSSLTVNIPVEFGMYDQYGDAVSSTADNRTGRVGTTLKGQLAYELYSVATIDNDGTGSLVALGTRVLSDLEDMTFNRGRYTFNASATIPGDNRDDDGFLVVLKPSIYSDSNATNTARDELEDTELRYAEDEVVVWVVEEAAGAADKTGCDLSGGPDGVVFPEIAVYADRNEFRTCFTLWRYDDSTDRFFIGSDEVGIGEFESALKEKTDPDDLTISIYSSRRSGLSVFRLN